MILWYFIINVISLCLYFLEMEFTVRFTVNILEGSKSNQPNVQFQQLEIAIYLFVPHKLLEEGRV